jgi:hypothetical protein
LVVDLMNQQQKHTLSYPGATVSPTGRTGSTSAATVEPCAEPTPPSDHESGLQHSISYESNSSESGVEKPFGHMSINKDEISYHGASHWQTILSSISDLKNELGNDEDGADHHPGEDTSGAQNNDWEDPVGASTTPHAVSELGLLIGNPVSLTKADLIEAMPEKRVSDRLMSLWFNSPDPFKPIIHAPTFQEEYKQYWKDPKGASVTWLGLTFAILSLAESFSLRDADLDSAVTKASLARVEKYHAMSASAAVLAGFTMPKKYTLECLIFYTAGLRSNDGFMKVWLMIGLILRLSLRMGYHRDPKYYPRLSPFDGEMRRRVWTSIIMIDILISFQLGLPSMVRTITTDTEPPTNLLDRDFGPACKVLPPGRSEDELTPASYARTKVGVVRIFAQAAELAHSTVPVTHEDVMHLDSELERACTDMPSQLKMPEMSEIVTDSPEQLMCRINLKLLVLKTRLILHRNFMLVPLEQLSRAEQLKGIGTSGKICVESALSVLSLQHAIHAESQLGGKLYTVKWYMESISTHDFLLAAMVVCLNLSKQISEDDKLRMIGSGIWCPRQQAMADALEKSYKIWGSGMPAPQLDVAINSVTGACESTMTSETGKASRAMGVMLNRVRKHFGERPGGEGICGPRPRFPSTSNQPVPTKVPFQGVVSQVPWTNDTPITTISTDKTSSTNNAFHSQDLAITNMLDTNQPFDPSVSTLDFSAIGDMIDGPVDWDMWDDQILQQHVQQVDSWDDTDLGLQSANSDSMDQHWSNDRRIVAGNAFLPNGTAPVMHGVSSVEMQFDWQDMQDADLDIRDYGTGGLVGRSPGWQGTG